MRSPSIVATGFKMADNNQSPWVDWLTENRFPGGDEEARIREMLEKRREVIIRNADISLGDTVLDAGCGEGFIGIKAAEETGSKGKVIFLDSSPDILDQAKSTVREANLAAATEFKTDSVTDLESIATNSIDVLTARSVLLFVSSPEDAFDEFYRILKSGGRFSINETIRQFIHEIDQGKAEDTLLGYNMEEYKTPPDHVIELVNKFWQYIENNKTVIDTTLFSERDLFHMAEDAGFLNINLDFHVKKNTIRTTSQWDVWLSSSFGPGRPTNREVLEKAFTEQERRQFVDFIRPIIESDVPKEHREASAYLYGVR